MKPIIEYETRTIGMVVSLPGVWVNVFEMTNASSPNRSRTKDGLRLPELINEPTMVCRPVQPYQCRANRMPQFWNSVA
jgi:hypothetical protein